MLDNLFIGAIGAIGAIGVWLLLCWLNDMHYSLNFFPSQKVIDLDISG